MRQRITALALLLAAALLVPGAARAERLENQVAVFAALDKVTARISTLPIELGKTVEFGALKVTPRVCFTRPPTEQPKTMSFVEVDEVQLDGRRLPTHEIKPGIVHGANPPRPCDGPVMLRTTA